MRLVSGQSWRAGVTRRCRWSTGPPSSARSAGGWTPNGWSRSMRTSLSAATLPPGWRLPRDPGTPRSLRSVTDAGVGWLAGAPEGPDAILQDPEAHDVAQVADRVIDPALVSEVGTAARLGENRLLQLETDQRPRSRGDEREPRRSRGDGDDCGRRVVRTHRAAEPRPPK